MLLFSFRAECVLQPAKKSGLDQLQSTSVSSSIRRKSARKEWILSGFDLSIGMLLLSLAPNIVNTAVDIKYYQQVLIIIYS